MPIPQRFVVTTYNIWGHNRWPQREQALRDFLRLNAPDILALQEFRLETGAVISEQLSGHKKVEDEFEGWGREGNIYWNSAIFELIEYGAKKIGMEGPDPKTARRLFWARLQIKETDKTILVATAHYTYQGHKIERETGQSPRIEQAKKTINALEKISPKKDNEPVIFMGDLNDAVNGIRTLRAGGFKDSWESIGQTPPPTHPTLPTAGKEGRRPDVTQVLDWQLHRGAIRVMNSQVADFYLHDLAPSDHKPVTVTYGID